jgi:hypothetical protein
MSPLIVQDVLRGAELVDDLLQHRPSGDLRDALIGAGYDGVVVRFGPDDFSVVAFTNDQVKVVQET